jgi:peptidoglycan/LPS O-acetylase OafA/YrhL
MGARPLLFADAVINLLLGVLLVTFPGAVVTALGIPDADEAFYPSVLGGVLFGIGIALLLEWRGDRSGLGLAGAMAINVSGGLVLGAWLVLGDLSLPMRGQAVLWGLVLLLLGISAIEFLARRKQRRG